VLLGIAVLMVFRTLRGWFDPPAPFFGAAAQAGEAMLVWLD
jgi:hypothetical protein